MTWLCCSVFTRPRPNSDMIAPRLACLGALRRYDSARRLEPAWATSSQSARRGQNHDLEFSSTHDRYRSPDHRGHHLRHLALSTVHSRWATLGLANWRLADRLRTTGRLSVLFCRSHLHARPTRRYVGARGTG